MNLMQVLCDEEINEVYECGLKIKKIFIQYLTTAGKFQLRLH